jgi:hypothetical protein
MVNLIQKSKLVAQLKKLGDDTYNEQYVIKDVLKELERVEKSIPKIPDNKPINDEIITLKGKFVALASSLVSMGDRLTNLKGHFETRIDKQGKITKEIEDDFKKVTDEIKKELEKISKTRQIYEVGAGNMNRQINVEGVDVLTKYTDINFYGVSSSVIASVDTANKRVNIGIPAGGGTGSGDVVGPSTNTDNYIPQWNGADSKTLKDGLAVPAGGLAGLTLVGTKEDKLTPTTVKTSNYSANVGEMVICDISGGSFTVILPTAPADKSRIEITVINAGIGKSLTVSTGGSDVFIKTGGATSVYMHLYLETFIAQYEASTGVWRINPEAAPSNFQIGFVGIDAQTPISNTDISINTTSRVLTITPPLGYFNYYIDGGGAITRYRQIGAIDFPAFTDTSGTWYFYFDSTGTAITTQTAWQTTDFPNIVAVYRILWNATLSGADKLVAQYIEYHQNTISAFDHQWYHLQGSIWQKGFDVADTLWTSGSPNADGRNTVVALSTGTVIDDNLPYTITNDTSGNPWSQDLGNTTPASLNATNSALFEIFVQDGSGNVSFLPATRFPFDWDSGTNKPNFITSTGTRTPVTDKNWFVYYIYSTQNPITGEAIKIVSAPTQFTSQTNAEASSWNDIQNAYSIFANDYERRPIYRLIFQFKASYSAGCKYSALAEVQDIRKTSVTAKIVASGSLPATSITFSPTSSIASTNVQAAIEEVDTTRVPNIRTLTIDGTSYDLSADRSWTTSAGGGINRISSVISVSSVLADTALKDFTVFANVGIKLTLPTAVNNLNKYTIKNVSSSSVLTICTGAETIDGSSTALINVANQSLDFLSDNTNWNVI